MGPERLGRLGSLSTDIDDVVPASKEIIVSFFTQSVIYQVARFESLLNICKAGLFSD
jgi:hypothetical protein